MSKFTKFDADKLRMDLVPPELMLGTAAVLTYGARKYSPNNWHAGAGWSRYYAALQRHLVAWWSGERVDADTGFSHLDHAACNLAFLMAYEGRGLGTDDRSVDLGGLVGYYQKKLSECQVRGEAGDAE